MPSRACGGQRRARPAAALDWPVPWSRGRGARPGGLDGVRAVEQRLTTQPAGDFAGFAGRGRGGLAIAGAYQVLRSPRCA